MDQFIGVIGAIWVWSGLLVAAPYFWFKRTNSSQSPMERRIRAIGLGLAWPYFVMKYFQGRSSTQIGQRAEPAHAGGANVRLSNVLSTSHSAAPAFARSSGASPMATPVTPVSTTTPRLPSQYGQGVEAYGQHLLTHPNGAGFNVERLGDILTILNAAQSDREGFVAAVEQAISDRSDAAALGAMEQITHVHGIRLEDTPAGLRILDRALRCLRERRVSWDKLKGFQQDRWLATQGPGTW